MQGPVHSKDNSSTSQLPSLRQSYRRELLYYIGSTSSYKGLGAGTLRATTTSPVLYSEKV